MREVVWLGHGNSVDYLCKENDSAVSLSTSTTMTLTLGTLVISSTNGSGQPIQWAQAGYSTGEVRIMIGGNTNVVPGQFDAPLIAYGPDYPTGLVWGKIGLIIMPEVEGT